MSPAPVLSLAADWPRLVRAAIRAALSAGEAIMEIYGRDFAVDYKDDRSPLTEADRAAQRRIAEELRATGLPVLSEESRAAPWEKRRRWPALWLVDPLDGTKEFVQRNGDFTVNVALIQDGHSMLGVVLVPAHRELYFAVAGVGAFRATGVGLGEPLEAALAGFPSVGGPFVRLAIAGGLPDRIRVVASRSHNTPETDAFVERLRATGRQVERVSRGSALKLCLIASGEAHVYPRLAPTMEWDTAAAQAVVEGAGGCVAACDDAVFRDFLARGPAALAAAAPLAYNRENLRNPWFIAWDPGMERL